MGFIGKLRSLGILPKLVLTFLLVLTPLYLIGLKMNVSGAGIVRDEIGNSSRNITKVREGIHGISGTKRSAIRSSVHRQAA
jgi:hypothetical protein